MLYGHAMVELTEDDDSAKYRCCNTGIYLNTRVVCVDTPSPEGRSKSLGEFYVKLIVLTAYYWGKYNGRQ